MLSPRISLKLYADPATVPEHAKLVEVWHAWIKDGTLLRAGASKPELLVDVVDYGHVHHGPSVLLVGHESDYALDFGEGRAGLLYVRKRAPDGTPGDRLPDSFARVAHAASLLEGDAKLGGLRFQTNDVLLRVLDRLNAPNEKATWDAQREEIERVAKNVLGPGTEATYDETEPRAPFTVRLRSSASRPVAEVLAAAEALVTTRPT